ncbi:hypothetical protein [Afipia sp. Root123D2]|uniref:hypothetical protein n=1 Tax=Afipia sp. Root123D2 TaxID=1736436 RepID=UPI0012E73CD9|nr:hypothetical protein [Afipia sp. Root123D2]
MDATIVGWIASARNGLRNNLAVSLPDPPTGLFFAAKSERTIIRTIPKHYSETTP